MDFLNDVSKVLYIIYIKIKVNKIILQQVFSCILF